jgi:hypothetical protein
MMLLPESTDVIYMPQKADVVETQIGGSRPQPSLIDSKASEGEFDGTLTPMRLSKNGKQ